MASQYLKGVYERDGDSLLAQPLLHRTNGNGFKIKEGRFSLDRRKNCFFYEGSETLAQVCQRNGRCPIPGDIQGHTGWGSEQPHLIKMSLITAEGLE